MKIAAHPLVVAMSLGLLGPAALADDDLPEADAACAGCEASVPTTVEEWAEVQAPSAEDLARVEAAWHSVTL